MHLTFLSQAISSTQSRLSSARGMTLPELLVTISILSVVSVALMSLIQTFYKDNNYLIEQTAALSSARRGVSEAVLAMRESSYGDDGSYPIAVAATSTLTIYSDADQDNSVERIKLVLTNGILYKVVTNASGTPLGYTVATPATTTIATDVRNTNSTPLFTYYNDAGTQLSTTSTNIASISSIQIQLMVDLNPARAPNVFTLTQSATLRNVNSQ